MIGVRPLFTLLRDGAPEVRIDGEIVVYDGERVLYQTSDAIGAYPARSVLKPFQFLAANVTPPDGVPEPRQIPALGSVSATREQVRQLEAWYGDEASLRRMKLVQCPAAYPWDETNRVLLKTEGKAASVLYGMCFAKHMAIVAACEANRWDPATYTSVDHPYHERLVGTIGAFLGRKIASLPTVTDGCRLPSPILSMADLARLFQGLAAAEPATKRAKIAAAMRAAPEWIGAPDRADTRLIRANPDRLIAKEGADGLFAVGVLPGGRHPRGLGIIVKTAAGFFPQLAAVALAPLLERLGLASAHEIPKGQTARYHYQPFAKDPKRFVDISPAVGPKTAVWPGDVAFQRDVSMDTAGGDHLTLSSIRTTVHVGAHTDAPVHFGKDVPGIDKVALERYRGACQVIRVAKGPNGLIAPADVEGTELRATRVLFRTGSYPDPRRFNEDFVALTGELVDWLAERGVVLVGIDTPSIDACHSKDLPAHHATARHKMAILEGIVLDGLEAGIYELTALPLKLEGADASPVRAVLEEP